MTKKLPNLILLKGLPGSGKTSWALEFLKAHDNYKRINKDDLRSMLDLGRKHSGSRERFVLHARDNLVLATLQDGLSVIVDDTNLNPIHETRLREITENLCTFEVKFIDTDVETCIENDLKRARSVGEKVIRGMYRDYLEPKYEAIPFVHGLPNVCIFDIDGTLAHKGDRDPFDYSKVNKDVADQNVAAMARLVSLTPTVVLVVSGREGTRKCRKATVNWLERNSIPFNNLYMRSEGDYRSDDIVKQELFEQHIKGKFNVLGVFDDRDKVVAMWRRLGLKCFQVQPGNF